MNASRSVGSSKSSSSTCNSTESISSSNPKINTSLPNTAINSNTASARCGLHQDPTISPETWTAEDFHKRVPRFNGKKLLASYDRYVERAISGKRSSSPSPFYVWNTVGAWEGWWEKQKVFGSLSETTLQTGTRTTLQTGTHTPPPRRNHWLLFLEAVVKFGAVWIEDLPVEENMIVDFVSKLGPLKSHNFGENGRED
jgi:hypothetical protein